MANEAATILFSDISGSTQLFDTLGDDTARKIVAETLNVMQTAVESFEGRVIKTIGDEIMAELPGPEKAVLAASAMQRNLEAHNTANSQNIVIKVGFHTGEVIREAGDVFGDAVNVAARMVGQCRPGQVLTTNATYERMPATMRTKMRSLGTRLIKGKEKDIEVFEILWQKDRSNITVVSRAIPSVTGELLPILVLNYQKEKRSIQKKDTPFILGRDLQSSIVVNDDCVSRNHAVIEYRQGQFILSDQSTNGTWVYVGRREKLFIHQESLHLHSAGIVSLGKDKRHFNSHQIEFRLEMITRS